MYQQFIASASRRLMLRGSEAADPISDRTGSRVQVHGKALRLDGQRWLLRGLTYGPFAPNSRGFNLPELPRIRQDFQHIRDLGANAVRVYHLPDERLLDEALEHGLRVLIDVPWEKHRCFFEDWSARAGAIAAVRDAAQRLGRHPATLAISVGNEIPKDVVRFYGARRVGQFVDELLDTVKQEAPDCLATYTNYPSTEFLTPARLDFYCANVYLDDVEVLGRYLDRLQHVAGALPLVLGEYGIDSIRQGMDQQAQRLEEHVRQVFRRGLAGSFVFSYTDDWFTGGHPITDWAFGITDAHRNEKPAAARLRQVWSQPLPAPVSMPRVSVVVCSYNGAATLHECLDSLMKLEYPDYEVILVDDGSTDETPEIAEQFASVRYLRQINMGLSFARNEGARIGTGEIIAYTDSDCVADPAWLNYLVQAMLDAKAEAVGGPNVPPPSDSWTAKCVAASPGGPSHVMLDDHYAEHVPGCNMAFRRDKLLEIGGFDAQYRQAGDDVDICWRFLDRGMRIVYAASALVWHHRRSTVRAYLKQQKGYGRAEAMLHYKHPGRFNALGCSRWRGIIYGEGAVGLPVATPAVYHGRFGSGLFQIAYRNNDYTLWGYCTLLEWHALAAFLLVSATMLPGLAWISAAMWSVTLLAILRSTARAPLPRGAPFWCRGTIGLMYLVQPLVRSWHRYSYRLKHKRLPELVVDDSAVAEHFKRVSHKIYDVYWTSQENLGREEFLEALVSEARTVGWKGNFQSEWDDHDLELLGDCWHNVRVHTATEELGWPNRFTRVRCMIRPTVFGWTVSAAAFGWTVASLVTGQLWALGLALAMWIVILLQARASRQRCLPAVLRLVGNAGAKAGLESLTAGTPRRLQRTASAPRSREDELQLCLDDLA